MKQVNSEIKTKALTLRASGSSIDEICKECNLAKGTVWYWIKDIPLQRVSRSRENASLLHTYTKRFINRTEKSKRKPVGPSRAEKISQWKQNAIQLYHSNKNDPMFGAGIALYWGEGGKREHVLSLCNSDAKLINYWLHWLRRFFPNTPLHFRLNLHVGNSATEALIHWENTCGIKQDNVKYYFLKVRNDKSDKPIPNRIPYGTMAIQVGVGSFECFTMMMQWIELMGAEYQAGT